MSGLQPRAAGPPEVRLGRIQVSAFCVPTEQPESDGTLEWDKTILVTVEASGGGEIGFGYTYADEAAATLATGKLADVVEGSDAMSIASTWRAMLTEVRNLGRPGIAATAVSAVDTALWDLKAKLLGIPLVRLLGLARSEVPVYGSGGFTSYTPKQLEKQLGRWASQGMPRVKMKVGRNPTEDIERVRIARRAIGEHAELFVDANGAYSCKQAIAFAEKFAAFGVSWFEEPVSSDDLDGLRLIRDRAPAGMDIAAGEYGYDILYFSRMLAAGAVDVLQADASRCCGLTGFLKAAVLCEAYNVPLSAHCAPSLHAHVCCAAGLSVTSSTFTITSASSACCSTAR